MSIDSVTNLALFQATIKDVNKVEVDIARQQMQLSSGNSAQDFSDMAGQVQQYLSLDNSIARTTQYLSNNQVVETRVEATNTALSQVLDVTTTLQSLISQRRTGTSNDSGFAIQLHGLWQNMVGQLNASVGGHYLFSGTRTDAPAVDGDKFPILNEDDSLNDDYYTGSKQDLTVRPQDNTTLTYNVRADAPGFQKIYNAIALASRGDSTHSDADLASAYDMLQSGIKDVISMQATTNSNKLTLANIDKSHQSVKLYWQGIKESIGNTDVLAVSTQLSINQGILQAAFQAFAKINSLRLSDYLK